MRYLTLILAAFALAACDGATDPKRDERFVSLFVPRSFGEICDAGAQTCHLEIVVRLVDGSGRGVRDHVSISGDGSHPADVLTDAAGVATFTWTYPASSNVTYALEACPRGHQGDAYRCKSGSIVR